MTLRFVTEMTTMAQMSQNREKNSKNFLQPEKRRSRRSRKPSTQRTKGSARCLRSCFRSTVGRSVRGAPGKVRGRRAPPGAEIRFRSRRRPLCRALRSVSLATGERVAAPTAQAASPRSACPLPEAPRRRPQPRRLPRAGGLPSGSTRSDLSDAAVLEFPQTRLSSVRGAAP